MEFFLFLQTIYLLEKSVLFGAITPEMLLLAIIGYNV